MWIHHKSDPFMAVSVPLTSHVSPLDLIFSCTVCQDTLSDVYAVPDDADGLRRGKDPATNIIPRLWLTECAHVTCGKHFDGGGRCSSLFFPYNTNHECQARHFIQKANNLVRPALIAKPRKQTTRAKPFSGSMGVHLANTTRISQKHTSRYHRSSSQETIPDWKPCA